MEVEKKQVGNILVVTPTESFFDVSHATWFKSQMADWIDEGNKRILLDLSHVDFMDSSGLGAILSGLKTVGKDGEMAICCVKDGVKNLFELTRMYRVFQVFSSRDDALKAMGV